MQTGFQSVSSASGIQIQGRNKIKMKGVQMMRAAIFTIDSGIYKAKAESAAASALLGSSPCALTAIVSAKLMYSADM